MNRFLIPKISRQLLRLYIPIGMIYFLILLFVMPQNPKTHLPLISYDAAGIYWALIAALFFAGHSVWVIFVPMSNSREEIRFLSTLPVSRKRIARNGIKLFFSIHGCVIPLILVIGLLLFLSELLTGTQLLGIIFACLWFTICTLLGHLISCAVKNWVKSSVIYSLTIFLIVFPLTFMLITTPLVFVAKPDNAFKILVLIVCSSILTGVSLFIHRYNEDKFMDQDLL